MPTLRDDELADRTRSYSAGDVGAMRRVLVFWQGSFVSRELPFGAQLVLGRAPACDVVVDHSSVSRQHLVVVGGPPVQVRDLGSHNGTRLRGQRLVAGEMVPIGPGDSVEMGAAIVVIQESASIASIARARPLATIASFPAPDAPGARERLIQLVAGSAITVLLLGETGAGKEVTAELLHRLSPRAEKTLVKMNCAALPEPLLESELFGYEKGAFTGAVQSKAGLLETAHGGTVFLDEIAELPLTTQSKLLRVLENGEVTRLGSVRPRTVDVRFIAATNRDLEAMIAERTFRQDLYFRLNGITLRVPPLRERREEIPALASTFLALACAKLGKRTLGISDDALDWLCAYSWPGNVRELRNLIDRSALLCAGDRIEKSDVAVHMSSRAPSSSAASPMRVVDDGPATRRSDELRRLSVPQADSTAGLRGELDALERERITDALERTGGNQSKAAQMLGISRRALIRRLDDYNLPRPRKGNE